ncbi:Glycoprotein-N-acetylgalactosamine 3-beta-galactosyltransferase 1 [Phytophthora ramorum]|uniref:Glycoprotein-N-acetylgalactosamine 3-beta-galactosyltransferase 1 n=1 Tax=Phytophthora ramorum TaxID=164328 RepID=UPI0030AB5F44|nr:Glycoprotein-N-acetylgalactosamine 3-beta-galactosyltransferase 1 [Phytophthora ramorum]
MDAERPPDHALSSPSKADLCALDVEDSLSFLNLIEVTPEPAPSHELSSPMIYPRILCFVNTISVHHKTRAQAVAETWGQRCDKLLFFSNMSDTITIGVGTDQEHSYDVIPLDVPADHDHLWQKHKATLQYVHKHYRHDYDWIYKADDDAYVIMENLRKYLRRPEVMQVFMREPIQMGHRFNLPESALKAYIKNETLRSLWTSQNEHLIYNSGGPGYVMNNLYVERLVKNIPEWTCLSDSDGATVPDDLAISFCLAWEGVYPWNTRDHLGRERWHALGPRHSFVKQNNTDSWLFRYHAHVGGWKSGFDSAAPDSIAIHYISPTLMYHLERSLYLCRAVGDDLGAFNRKFGLALGDKVQVN